MTNKRLALIIASYQYQDAGLRRLVAPTQDAEALARVLEDRRIGRFKVKTLLDEPCDKVRREINAFFTDRQHRRDDMLLLYFSCHGLKDDFGRLYFAMPDTDRELLRSTAVAARFVHDVMLRSHSRRQVLILDCCYGGAYMRDVTYRAGEKVGVGEYFEGHGRAVLTASNSMQYAFEGGDRKGEAVRSVFTHALVHGLESGEADLDNDGSVTFDELYDYIYDRVTDEEPRQNPTKWVDVKGQIIVAWNPNPVSRPDTSPPESQLVAEAHKAPRELDHLRPGSNGELPTDSDPQKDKDTLDHELKQLGKYEIIEKIGHGAHAVVYRARDTELGRIVALKVLHPKLTTDPKFVERFKREARTLAKLDHPHIATIYDAGEIDGKLYLDMEFARGPSLEGRIQQQGPLSWENALEILDEVAQALDFVHEQGLVHRDIKPSNILLDPVKGALLGDFGTAKLIESLGDTLTTDGSVPGTLPYMAPELCDGKEPTPASDIYALGCVVYEMITGKVLFGNGSPIEVMNRHSKGAPLDVGRIGKGFAIILSKALEKSPDKRYQRAGNFVAALQDEWERSKLAQSRPRLARFALEGGAIVLLVVMLVRVFVIRGPLPYPLPPIETTATELPTKMPTEIFTEAPTAQRTEMPTEARTLTVVGTEGPTPPAPSPTSVRTLSNTLLPPADAPLPTVTRSPTNTPSGKVSVLVKNQMGVEVTFNLGAQTEKIPPNGETRFTVVPGHMTWTANTPDGYEGGGEIDIQPGLVLEVGLPH